MPGTYAIQCDIFSRHPVYKYISWLSVPSRGFKPSQLGFKPGARGPNRAQAQVWRVIFRLGSRVDRKVCSENCQNSIVAMEVSSRSRKCRVYSRLFYAVLTGAEDILLGTRRTPLRAEFCTLLPVSTGRRSGAWYGLGLIIVNKRRTKDVEPLGMWCLWVDLRSVCWLQRYKTKAKVSAVGMHRLDCWHVSNNMRLYRWQCRYGRFLYRYVD